MEKINKWFLAIALISVAAMVVMSIAVPFEVEDNSNIIAAQERELRKLRAVRDSLYTSKKIYQIRLDSVLRSVAKEREYSKKESLEWIEEYNSSLLEE